MLLVDFEPHTPVRRAGQMTCDTLQNPFPQVNEELSHLHRWHDLSGQVDRPHLAS